MNSLKLSLIILPLLLVSLFAASASAQSSTSNSASDAAMRLRSMYFARDYEGGYVEGKKFMQQYPDAGQVKVWFVLSACRIEREDEALELAEKWKADEKDGWGLFAIASALSYQEERKEEALAASEKALALLPGNDDALWLRASITRRVVKLEDSIDFIERNLNKVKNPAELLTAKSWALYLQNNNQQNGDGAKMKASQDALADALKADPKNIDALYLQAYYLLQQKRAAEAHPILKRALALSPNATSLHEDYWRAVNGRSDLSDEAKQKEIDADIQALMQLRGNYPGVLLSVARQYETMGLGEKRKKIEDRILLLHPMGREAEWVLTDRARQLSEKMNHENSQKDPAEQEAYRKMLLDYISRPRHFNKGLLGETYTNLFFLIKDDAATSNDELLTVAKKMVQYEKLNVGSNYTNAAIALAERKIHFREAEAIAREGIVEAKKWVDSHRQFYSTDAEYEKALNSTTGAMHDALGWVFFNEGRMEEAEKELLHANSLIGENHIHLYHVGQLYQAKKDYAKAEGYYIEGSLVPVLRENKNAKALKALYELRNGSLEGYDKYLAKIDEIDAADRKSKVLADRVKEPKQMSAFKLKTLGGKMLSSADLKGRVVVINYWGIWCGWCVEEMPEFQELYKKYKDDKEVMILTINNDRNPADVPKWMQKNKYDFNVLFDDGYVDAKAVIQGFPTTWFVDKEGRIAFVKEGWTKKLTEEFSWRIEALKAANAASN
ncbi:MAG TPA: redoxin domain-containing protein [Blastocatellia bacterium]|nr:redoxin domain-containing protein [Blastocatellia bacterium]